MPTLDEYLADQPEKKPKRGGGIKPEHVLQIAVKQWLTEALPAAVVWTAVDHGIWFNSDLGMRMWARLKARGIKPGIPDLHFWWNEKYLAIELKVGEGKLTEDEEAWLKKVSDNGFGSAACWTVSEVEAALRSNGFPVRTSSAGIDARLPLRTKPKRKTASKPRQKTANQAALRAIARARRDGTMI